jgi:hypothetical protein
MLIRPKYHWLVLAYAALNFACVAYVAVFKSDTFLLPLGLLSASFLLVVWASTYTTLSGGVLTRRVLFFPYQRIRVDEIARIAPHEKNGKWSYGTVVNVFARNGEKLTVQPDQPLPFLAALREQAPQAAYLF